MVQVTESDYKTAQAGDAKVRQDFLDAIDLEEAGDFVKKVYYDPSPFSPHERGSFTAMSSDTLIFKFFNFSLSLGRSRISVYPKSFDIRYPSFMCTLIKHEGQHARQSMYHPYSYAQISILIEKAKNNNDSSFSKYLESLLEIPALTNELMSSNKFGLSHEEKYNSAQRVCIHLGDLHSYSGRNLKKDFRRIRCDTLGDDFAERLIFEKDPAIFLLGKS